MTERPPADSGPALALTVNQASALLGIGLTTTWALIGQGQLRVLRIGRRVVIPRFELERFIREEFAAQNETGSAPVHVHAAGS